MAIGGIGDLDIAMPSRLDTSVIGTPRAGNAETNASRKLLAPADCPPLRQQLHTYRTGCSARDLSRLSARLASRRVGDLASLGSGSRHSASSRAVVIEVGSGTRTYSRTGAAAPAPTKACDAAMGRYTAEPAATALDPSPQRRGDPA